MKRITTLVVREEKFEIVHYMDRYCAINTKYIENGRLVKQLNGLQMHARNTLAECIDETRMSVEVKYMVDELGMTIEDAIKEYYRKEMAV